MLVFIDSGVDEAKRLRAGTIDGATLFLLDASRDGLQQITETLANQHNVASVHLITHGAAGQLQLGDHRISIQELDLRAKELRSWSKSLTANADILFYGCNLGAGHQGARFVQKIAELTGADVTASIDVTGDQRRGGDWDLEHKVGLVQSELVLSPMVRDRYEGVLDVTIYAAGATNTEQMQLLIDEVVVQTWNNIVGDAFGGVFQAFTFNEAAGVTADQVRVAFTNDGDDPASGVNRDLLVDRIELNSGTFQTEGPDVFSTGTWDAGGLTPGFKQSEYLHSTGYFQYAAATNGNTLITIDAAGSEGDEIMDLLIDGQVVQTFNNVSTTGQVYNYQANGLVTPDRVRIAFSNDLFDPANGIDRNLIVDNITIDGVTYETEAADGFSTGTWQPDDGITPGFRQSEILHSSGEFRYAAKNTGNVSKVTIRAAGDTGTENMDLRIDGTTVGSWTNVSTTSLNYTIQTNGTVTSDRVQVAFTNDFYDPANGIDSNLIVDFISIDGVIYQTEHPSVFSTGTWLPADGITPGFRQSEILHTNGNFQFAGVNAGVISLSTSVIEVGESAGLATLTIDRANGSTGNVLVDIATLAITATDG